MNMDRAYIEPLYLLTPTKKCLRTSISPGLIFGILQYCLRRNLLVSIMRYNLLCTVSLCVIKVLALNVGNRELIPTKLQRPCNCCMLFSSLAQCTERFPSRPSLLLTYCYAYYKLDYSYVKKESFSRQERNAKVFINFSTVGSIPS